MNVAMQMVAEEGGCGMTTIGLMRCRVDIFYQFICNQTRIVEALVVIITSDSRARSQQVVDELTSNRCA